MHRMENDFLDSKIVKPWLWLRYIDDIFFIWTEGGEDKVEGFLNSLNKFHPNLKFTHEKSNSSVNFLVLFITNLKQNYFVNPLIAISFSILIMLNHFTTQNQLFTARDSVLKGLAHLR